MVEERIDYELKMVELQLQSDIKVVQEEKLKLLQKNRDSSQPNQFLYLIAISLIHVMKMAIIVCFIVINLKLTKNGEKCIECMWSKIQGLVRLRMVVMVLEYFVLDICILLKWLNKDAIIEKESLYQQVERKNRNLSENVVRIDI